MSFLRKPFQGTRSHPSSPVPGHRHPSTEGIDAQRIRALAAQGGALARAANDLRTAYVGVNSAEAHAADERAAALEKRSAEIFAKVEEAFNE